MRWLTTIWPVATPMSGAVRSYPPPRVVHAEVLADGAHHYEARVEAYLHTELQPVASAHILSERLQASLNRQRGAQRPLIDRPFVAMDGAADVRVCPQLPQNFRPGGTAVPQAGQACSSDLQGPRHKSPREATPILCVLERYSRNEEESWSWIHGNRGVAQQRGGH